MRIYSVLKAVLGVFCWCLPREWQVMRSLVCLPGGWLSYLSSEAVLGGNGRPCPSVFSPTAGGARLQCGLCEAAVERWLPEWAARASLFCLDSSSCHLSTQFVPLCLFMGLDCTKRGLPEQTGFSSKICTLILPLDMYLCGSSYKYAPF